MFAKEVNVQVDVLSPVVVDRVLGESDGTHVVVEDRGGAGREEVETVKEAAEEDRLMSRIAGRHELGLGGGEGGGGLTLRPPGDGTAEGLEDVARRRAKRLGAAPPVGVCEAEENPLAGLGSVDKSEVEGALDVAEEVLGRLPVLLGPAVEMASEEGGGTDEVRSTNDTGSEEGADDAAIGIVLGEGVLLVGGGREGEAGRKRSFGRVRVSEVDIDEEGGEVVLK